MNTDRGQVDDMRPGLVVAITASIGVVTIDWIAGFADPVLPEITQHALVISVGISLLGALALIAGVAGVRRIAANVDGGSD